MIVFAVVITKNFLRIKESYKLKNKWPNIYNFCQIKKRITIKKLKPIFVNGELLYYFSWKRMYTISHLAQIYKLKK